MASRKKTRMIEVPVEEEAPPKHRGRRVFVLLLVFVFAIIALTIILSLPNAEEPAQTASRASLAPDMEIPQSQEGWLGALLRLEATLRSAALFVRNGIVTVLGWVVTGSEFLVRGIQVIVGWISAFMQWLQGVSIGA